MATVASKGLARAKEIYQNPDRRVKELKAEGKKIIGYLCIYPIIEMLTALDIVPYRIFGDVNETPTRVDAYMPQSACPFLRSLTDIGMKGRFDFFDGAIFASICEVGRGGIPNLWRNTIPLSYTHYLATPQVIQEETIDKMKGLVRDFQTSLEEYTGEKLTKAKLQAAIEAHNEQRALVRALYDLRKPDPPLISGVETLQVLKAIMGLPVNEGSELLREVINEIKERKDGPTKKPTRLLLWGSCTDDTSFAEMLESLDANIVMDDICVGSRAFFDDVEITDDPIDGLAHRYMVELKCPRTFRDAFFGTMKKDYMVDLEYRFSYLKDYAKEWQANGVIFEVLRFCDCHGYEVPGLKDYLDSLDIPNIYLERDYSEAALAPLRTRAQGFLELIS